MNKKLWVQEKPIRKEDQIAWQKKVIREELLKSSSAVAVLERGKE
ncbi:hypothetical protein [Brevibacillus daliensis]|nr:hypothetical protein [Brevibacillus daliensis]